MPLADSLLCGHAVEDTPRWVGVSGQHRTESGGPLVALNLCVLRRYCVGERGLVSTSFFFCTAVATVSGDNEGMLLPVTAIKMSQNIYMKQK